MKHYLSLYVSIVLYIFTSCKDKAADSIPTNINSENEWIELINGKDMSGWKASETPGTWFVTEDGLFQAVGKRSHLWYIGDQLKDSFKNFELEVLVKTFPLANSGIYFHTHYQETGWPGKGMEIQVNNSHIGEGDYIELKKMASLYGIRNMYKSFSKDSAWMKVKERVESNRVQIWLNDIKTVDYVQPDSTAPGVMRLSKGTFCLQGHDSLSKMQYKSFKVRRLTDDTKSDKVAGTYGNWHDSLWIYQGKQFAFIDLHPQTDMNSDALADYVYNTGINAALVKSPQAENEIISASNKPLFTGLRINASEINIANDRQDYVLGASTTIQEAQTLLSSGKINIWSHTGEQLNTKNVSPLLDLAMNNKIALEINNTARTPSIEIIKAAKAKGVKITFSGLIPAEKMDASMYILDAIKGAGLSYKDLYIPK